MPARPTSIRTSAPPATATGSAPPVFAPRRRRCRNTPATGPARSSPPACTPRASPSRGREGSHLVASPFLIVMAGLDPAISRARRDPRVKPGADELSPRSGGKRQRDEGDRAEHDAIPREHAKAVPADEIDQPAHNEQRGDELDDKADDDQHRAVEREDRAVL